MLVNLIIIMILIFVRFSVEVLFGEREDIDILNFYLVLLIIFLIIIRRFGVGVKI